MRCVVGVDKLKVSLWIHFPDQTFLEEMEDYKTRAQKLDVPSLPIEYKGLWTWNIKRTGNAHYPFHLERGDCHVFFNRRRADAQIPNVRLEIGSSSCWAPGFGLVYEDLIEFLSLFGGRIIKERVSEVHLAADVIGQDIRETTIADQNKWICRAHAFGIYYDRKVFSGITYGKGDFMLRIYDKVLELRKSTAKQDLFADAWGVTTFDDQPVTRVEFQLRRPILREFVEDGKTPINTVYQLNDSLSSLWAYCAGTWARLSDRDIDRDNKNQSRYSPNPFWLLVQQAVWTGRQTVQRIKATVQQDLVALRKQARGVLMTVAALLGKSSQDIKGIVVCATETISADLFGLWNEDKDDFIERMQRKTNVSGWSFAADNPVKY